MKMLLSVACMAKIVLMGTTTIRLGDEDGQILDTLAPEFGGKSGAVRHALRLLAADRQRRDALNAFLEAWNTEAGPLDEDAVAAMAKRYGL